jgi:hypothetical protein
MPRAWHGTEISPIWRVTPPSAWERVTVDDPHAYAALHGEPVAVQRRDEENEAIRRSLNSHARLVMGSIFG